MRPSWVACYRWPETFRFKHLEKMQPFKMHGRTYVRLSARRYVPAEVSVCGHLTVHSSPVRCIDSINIPVNTAV
jgi:hypothetical protein